MGRLPTHRRRLWGKNGRRGRPIREKSEEKTRKSKYKIINPERRTLIDREGLDDSQWQL